MLTLTIDRSSGVPLYRQLADHFRDLIRAGTLPPGARLPPVRTVAAELGLTRLTVHSAYMELQAQGLTEAVVGRGTFVATSTARTRKPATQTATSWMSQGLLAELTQPVRSPAPSAPSAPSSVPAWTSPPLGGGSAGGEIALSMAYPGYATYPRREFAAALEDALPMPSMLGYGVLAGDEGLREQVAALLLERELAVPPEHVLITAGAQQGQDVALRALAEPNDVVLMQEPTFPGAIESAALRSQRVVGVPMDDGGISIAALEAACARYRPRLLYLVHTFHNPSGILPDAARRREVLRVARTYDVLIVEDDTYGLMPFGPAPAPPPLKADDPDGRIIYVMSMSKILMPGLRLGAIVASPELLPRLAATKQSTDLSCSPLLQRALAIYLAHGHLSGHLRRVRRTYREQCGALLDALDRHLPLCTWTRPEGGLSLWLTLPRGVDEAALHRGAMERDVLTARGQIFYLTPHAAGSVGHLRLSFGVEPPERIALGVALLGRALRELHGPRAWTGALTGRAATPIV